MFNLICKHMYKSFFFLWCMIILLVSSCDKTSDEPVTSEGSKYTLTVNFEFGEELAPTGYGNIYVCWIENKNSDYLQNIKICSKLINGGLTGTALPYWKLNVYPSSNSNEVDAVTSATVANSDFTVSAGLKDGSPKQFTVYLETDRSFEPNDWFTDQPALLYSADIDLDDNITEYELNFIGWTPNEKTENKIPGTPMGILQNEVRYITQHKNGTDFGTADERSLTRMVEEITLSITKQ